MTCMVDQCRRDILSFFVSFVYFIIKKGNCYLGKSRSLSSNLEDTDYELGQYGHDLNMGQYGCDLHLQYNMLFGWYRYHLHLSQYKCTLHLSQHKCLLYLIHYKYILHLSQYKCTLHLSHASCIEVDKNMTTRVKECTACLVATEINQEGTTCLNYYRNYPHLGKFRSELLIGTYRHEPHFGQ